MKMLEFVRSWFEMKCPICKKPLRTKEEKQMFACSIEHHEKAIENQAMSM